MDITYIPVTMLRRHLLNIPEAVLPEGFTMRTFQPGDEQLWAEIEQAAGEFDTQEQALLHFEKEFGHAQDQLTSRCFFLCNPQGIGIGTANAWFHPDYKGACWGRIHWVAIRPEYQGRKLSKPMVAHALRRLSLSHDKAYLTTQTTSYIAVKVYLDLGFEPCIETETCTEGWRMLADALNHPDLVHLYSGGRRSSNPR